VNEKRKGEIALAVLKYRISEIALAVLKYRINGKGIRLTPDIKRELVGNVAKATGIPQEELKEFGKILIEELLEETFDK